MKKESDSRRAFLQKFGALAASVTIVPIAAGCGGGNAGSEAGAASSGGAASGGGAGAVAKVDCNDLSALTEQDRSIRQTLSYVTSSPDPAKLCNNCQFWTTPEANATCGGCSIMKGPIAAKGYCTSWAAKPA